MFALAFLSFFVGSASATPGLQYIYHHDLSLVWRDAGSGATKDGSFWSPVNIPNGYFYLGHFDKSGHTLNLQTDHALLVKPLTADSVQRPIALEWIYDDYKTGSDWELTIFNPVPPHGYRCLGHVALRARRMASVEEFPGLGCVKEEFAVPAVAGEETWNDLKSGGRYDFSSWKNVPVSNFEGMSVNTFVGHQSYGTPVSLSSQFVLKRSGSVSGATSIPTENLPDLIREYAPYVMFHPEDQYMPDDAEFVFNRSMINYGIISNEGSYDGFGLMDNGEIPMSAFQGNAYLKADQAAIKRFLTENNHISRDNGHAVWLRIPEPLYPGNLERSKAYVKVVADHTRPYTDIVFYFFYPFNGPGKFEFGCGFIEQQGQMTMAGRHQGDFEAYTLRIYNGSNDTPPVPVSVYLSVHTGGYWTNYNDLLKADNHPVVFSAKDSHAMFPRDGVQGYCRPRAINVALCTFYVELQDYTGWGPVLKVPEQWEFVDERMAEKGWLSFDGRWGDYERVFEWYPLRVSSYKRVESGPSGPARKTSWKQPEDDLQVTCD